MLNQCSCENGVQNLSSSATKGKGVALWASPCFSAARARSAEHKQRDALIAEKPNLSSSANTETSFVYQGKRGFCVYFPDGLWYNDPVTEKNRRNA
jgi:hypothetical protein